MISASNDSPRSRILTQALICIFVSALTNLLQAAPGWTMERFTDIGGEQISNLTDSSAIYSPTSTTILNTSAMPTELGDNYGTRIRGYVIAPVTGLYTFWASGDDAVTLMLSPDENPANMQVIASHVGWTYPQEWEKYPTQKSRRIPLVAGTKYYIEALHKEGAGGDNLAIGWTPPASERSLIPLSAMETYSPDVSDAPAGLTHEFYADIDGITIADLVNAPAFQAIPTTTTVQTTGLAASYVDDSYGVRLRGYITPQVSGNYTFWESGDDHVQLFLSPSDNPADKKLIASHTGWTDPQQWDKYTSQESIPLNLTAGRSYYIEVLLKEGFQGDHLAIAWTRPDGSREILPTHVLNAWMPADNDADGDLIPNALELALGLNPANRADANADADSNSISNLVEYRSFSNPTLTDEVAGHLLDEIWLGLPGDKLNRASYKTAATRQPDLISHVTTTYATDVGEEYVRRVRGYIMAPVTGDYEFWGTADDDVDFHLSTSSNKFQLQHIIRSNVLGGGTSFDNDPSQRSQLITLTAGQKYYFELWHKEGRIFGSVALAWKTPIGSRELIPSDFLTSYATDPDDQDDDGLSDSWELTNGLSITDDGRTSGSADGTYGDLDGDGLINLEEFKNNTKANLNDSDGDGVSDYDEVHFFNSATLASDVGAFTPLAKLAGDAYTSSFGEWVKSAGKARQNGRRGSVTYLITVPTSGIHALKFTISSILDGNKNEQHDFHLKLNGQHLAYKSITILPDGTSSLPVLTPWLQAGVTYDLELFVDNSYNWRRVSIDQLEILAAGGTDSNGNATPDWTEIRVNDLNGLDTHGTIHSCTSPAVIEGKAKHLGLLSTNAPTPIAAPNGRFFTEVPLTAGAATELNFSFENQALSQTATVHWLPTNLKQQSAITVREGDSLLLTAFDDAENSNLESYSYVLDGITNGQASNLPTAQLFNTPGNHTITVTHTTAANILTHIDVTINVIARITLTPPVCVTGFSRLWHIPSVSQGVAIIFDDKIDVVTNDSRNYNILTLHSENIPILIRHEQTGILLGSSHIKGVCVRTSSATGNQIESYNATSIRFQVPVVITGDLSTAEIRCDALIGGVTFSDNTTKNSKYLDQFDRYGVSAYSMIIYDQAHSNCHRISVVQDGQIIMLSH